MAQAVVLTRGSIEVREDFAEELKQILEGLIDDSSVEFTVGWEEAQPLFTPRVFELPLAHAGAA